MIVLHFMLLMPIWGRFLRAKRRGKSQRDTNNTAASVPRDRNRERVVLCPISPKSVTSSHALSILCAVVILPLVSHTCWCCCLTCVRSMRSTCSSSHPAVTAAQGDEPLCAQLHNPRRYTSTRCRHPSHLNPALHWAIANLVPLNYEAATMLNSVRTRPNRISPRAVFQSTTAVPVSFPAAVHRKTEQQSMADILHLAPPPLFRCSAGSNE